MDLYFQIFGVVIVLGYIWYSIKEAKRLRRELDTTIGLNAAAREQLRLRELEHKEVVRQRNSEVADLDAKLARALENNKTVVSQRKSSEVRLGQISEHLVPFLDGFPYNVRDCRFLGMPIDFLVFDFDKSIITFLEVKTGGSKQSDRQKAIKDMIENGLVEYKEIRLNEKGMSIK